MEAYDPLNIPTAAVTPGSAALQLQRNRQTHAILIEMSGSRAGRVHTLPDTETTVGRGEQASLVFDDATLSRLHARIVPIPGGHVLVDSQSLNGCYVNFQQESTVQLKHGDRVRLGSGVRLQYQLVTDEEEALLRRMYDAAVLDGLTGLTNRRALDDRLLSELAHATRHGREMSVLLIDIDHFKAINDTHGHLAGDEVLRAVADTLQAQVRCEDLVARYGGEEFCVIARDIPIEGASAFADRLRKAVLATTTEFESLTLTVSVSVGIAALSRVESADVPTLLKAADDALYAAKAAGRNCISVAPSQRPV